MNTLADRHLDVTKPWLQQSLAARITLLSEVKSCFSPYAMFTEFSWEAHKKFPKLKSYENDWVVVDFLMVHLKTAKQRRKRQESNLRS